MALMGFKRWLLRRFFSLDGILSVDGLPRALEARLVEVQMEEDRATERKLLEYRQYAVVWHRVYRGQCVDGI